MSADAIGKSMPPVVTLDHLAEMNAADEHGHRYETSPEGVLSVMPPADSAHAVIASRLFAWFLLAGWPAEQILQVAGIRIAGQGRDGGRIPDISVWETSPPDGVWLLPAGLLLAIEIVSPGSEAMDEVIKRKEYASVGIEHYWVVSRDAAQTVRLYGLSSAKVYEELARVPLAWLLQTKPEDHLGKHEDHHLGA
ncbi:Uma2 family endonuclease [Catenuloplanes sp. NPDC051500]|uniref:Uma2 family endonuclease n=1 Tax=Catenuloplanes sp. NPDC051500 TaxID=3363959 RepID=UPI0037B3F3A2